MTRKRFRVTGHPLRFEADDHRLYAWFFWSAAIRAEIVIG